MNEFYRPDGSRNENDKSETTYAEPADELNIVVDDGDTGAAFCSKCGNRLDAGDAFCSRCGAKTFGTEQTQTSEQTYSHTRTDTVKEFFSMTDTRTRTAQTSGNVYNYTVNNIGSSDTQAYIQGNLKDKRVSIALCLLFGYCGAHRFYEGKIATGILYACTFGLFGIGWLVDLIILLSKPKKYLP